MKILVQVSATLSYYDSDIFNGRILFALFLNNNNNISLLREYHFILTSDYYNIYTGFLAEEPEEYASHFSKILDGFESLHNLRQRARDSCKRFSDEVFIDVIQRELPPLLNYHKP